ncbi:MAG TPA: hypothetical protein EYQ50_00015 [Verrucomicrobiales bacterium]|nr:hypothetical protein [Verrucomicrobiales bacterium]HIL70480.1 hypothetical protein [Verrucomicrobiota bacterium]
MRRKNGIFRKCAEAVVLQFIGKFKSSGYREANASMRDDMQVMVEGGYPMHAVGIDRHTKTARSESAPHCH